VTSRHRGPKRKLLAGAAYAAHFCKFFNIFVRRAPGECYYNMLLCWDDYFSSSSVVWYRALSLRSACIRSLGIILIPQATFVPNFVSFAATIAELAHGEKSCSHSLTHLDAPGTETSASVRNRILSK